MIVEVYRGAGDRVGTPITEPMLSDTMLITRGKSEMNANAHQFNAVELQVIPKVGLKLGQLISFQDVTTTTLVKAKITGISLSISRSSGLSMSLSVGQPV